MVNKMEEYADKLRDNNINNTKSYIDQTYNELVDTKIINTLPEWVFLEYFLDYFMNGGANQTDQPLYYKWVELSGSVYNEVNVIDGDGTVLYTVPPLMVNPIEFIDNFENVNFEDIMANYNLRTNRTPIDGIKYLNGAIGGMGDLIVPENNALELITARWINIFNRYRDNSVNNNTDNKLSVNNNIGDFIDYD